MRNDLLGGMQRKLKGGHFQSGAQSP